MFISDIFEGQLFIFSVHIYYRSYYDFKENKKYLEYDILAHLKMSLKDM